MGNQQAVDRAYELISRYIPANTKLTVEQTNNRLMSKYLVRLTYVSQKSGRTITISAKGDTLPTQEDEVLRFYVAQIVLTPQEAAREFNRVYFLEKRARQEAFINSNYKDSRRIAIVSALDEDKDKIGYPAH